MEKSFVVIHISHTPGFFDLRGRRLVIPLNKGHDKPKHRKPKPKRSDA